MYKPEEKSLYNFFFGKWEDHAFREEVQWIRKLRNCALLLDIVLFSACILMYYSWVQFQIRYSASLNYAGDACAFAVFSAPANGAEFSYVF